jgi:hypothetical protein
MLTVPLMILALVAMVGSAAAGILLVDAKKQKAARKMRPRPARMDEPGRTGSGKVVEARLRSESGAQTHVRIAGRAGAEDSGRAA